MMIIAELNCILERMLWKGISYFHDSCMEEKTLRM